MSENGTAAHQMTLTFLCPPRTAPIAAAQSSGVLRTSESLTLLWNPHKAPSGRGGLVFAGRGEERLHEGQDRKPLVGTAVLLV